jgi:hypothetical protein
MSADFMLLVLTAIATALGFWAPLKLAARHPAAWIASLVFLAVGIQTAVHITAFGAGEILPGRQLNPEVQRYWAQLLEHGLLPTPRASFCLAVILAHVLAIIARPSKAATFLPLPATAFFVIYFFVGQAPREVGFPARTMGGTEAAFLTVTERGGRATMWISVGREEEVFLRIVHRHEAAGPPPDPSLQWSRDGKVVTFTTRQAMPFFALDPEGRPTGWLPVRATEWPTRFPTPADSTDYRRVLSTAQVAVTELLNEHGGLAKE